MSETALADVATTTYSDRFAEELPDDARLFEEAFKVLRQTRLPKRPPSATLGSHQTPGAGPARKVETQDRRRMFWLDRGPRGWLKRIERPLARLREAAQRCDGPLLTKAEVATGSGLKSNDLTRFCWLAQLGEVSARRLADRKQFEWSWQLLFDLLKACVALRRGTPADQALILNTAEMRLLRVLRRWADRKKNTGDLLEHAHEELISFYDDELHQAEAAHVAHLAEANSNHGDVRDSFQRLATERRATLAYLLVSTFRQRQGFYPGELETVAEAYDARLPADPFADDAAPLRWRISDGEKLAGWGVDSPGRKLRTRAGQPLLYSLGADGTDTDGHHAWDGTSLGTGNWYFPLPAPKIRRRWFQFDLRSFLIVFTIIALGMAYFSSPAARQKRAIRSVQRNGGVVEFDTINPGSTRSTLIDWFGEERFGKVISIDMSDAEIHESSFASLQDFPYLVSLDVSGTTINDDHLAGLAQATDLTSFRAAHTEIKGPGLAHFANMQMLNYIDLDRSKLTDEGLPHLAKLKRLEHLDIRGTQITDEGLKAMPGLPQLNHLYMLDTQLTDDGLVWLGKCPKLQHIDIDGSKITGTGLAHLEGLDELTSLDIRNTNLEPDCLKHLPPLKELSSLMVGNTEFSDASFPYLLKQKKLASLSAAGTQIGDQKLMELTKLPKLTSVDLDETNVSQLSAWALEKSRKFEEFTWSPKTGGEETPGLGLFPGVPPSIARAIWKTVFPFERKPEPDFIEFDDFRPIPQFGRPRPDDPFGP